MNTNYNPNKIVTAILDPIFSSSITNIYLLQTKHLEPFFHFYGSSVHAINNRPLYICWQTLEIFQMTANYGAFAQFTKI